MKSRRKVLTGIFGATVAVLIAGCGSGNASTSTSVTAATSPALSSGLSTTTQKAVDAAYQGDYGMPPATSPKPQAGKNIWLVSLSSTLGTPDAVVAAAKLLGWHVTIFDGKFDPGTIVNGLREAIAAKADGIITTFVDCAPIKAGLQDVKKANIPVIGVEGVDCNTQVGTNGVEQNTGQPGLFTAQVLYNTPYGGLATYPEYWSTFAAYQALGLINGTKGRAKIIALNETDIQLSFIGLRTFKATLKQYCPGCTVVDTVDFVGTDFGSSLQQKVAQALVQHPEANAVFGEYDAPTQDAATAVVGSDRKDSIFVMGGEGTAPVADLIRQNRGVNAGVGESITWESWAAVDALNRLFHGEKPNGGGFPSGIGIQLYDANHNLPPKGQRFQSPVDFEAAYRKAWGVRG